MTLVRSSIILLYIRIFPMRWFHYTCYSIMIINAISFVAIGLSELLVWFKPPSDMWALPLIEILALIFNLLLDVVVVVLPIPTLWHLQMPIGKKVMLSGIFGLGVLICAMTAVRLEVVDSYFIGAFGADHVAFRNYYILSFFEPVLSVITACLPVLGPVFNKAHQLIKRIGDKLAMRSFFESGSIPIVMRVSQMWNSVSAQRAERAGVNSIVAMEDWRRVHTEIRSTSQAERHEGQSLPDSLPDIHVQKDIHIEIASDSDRVEARDV